jgi:hypothetical protein
MIHVSDAAASSHIGIEVVSCRGMPFTLGHRLEKENEISPGE